jgi:uncharacterized coiled-coil protein SlyX
MNITDALFQEISNILKKMQETDKFMDKRIDILYEKINRLENSNNTSSEVGSETGIEDSKEYR